MVVTSPFTNHPQYYLRIEEVGPLVRVSASSWTNHQRLSRSSCLENYAPIRLLDHFLKPALQARCPRLMFNCAGAWMWNIWYHRTITGSIHQLLRLNRSRICLEATQPKSRWESARHFIVKQKPQKFSKIEERLYTGHSIQKEHQHYREISRLGDGWGYSISDRLWVQTKLWRGHCLWLYLQWVSNRPFGSNLHRCMQTSQTRRSWRRKEADSVYRSTAASFCGSLRGMAEDILQGV